MGILRWGCLGVGFSLVTSCWSPVFDADISLALLTKNKLSQEAKFQGQVGYSSDNQVFLAVPSRSRNPAFVSVFNLSATSYGQTLFKNSGGGWSGGGATTGGATYSAVPDPELITVQAGIAVATTDTWVAAVFEPTMLSGSVNFGGTPADYPGKVGPAVLGFTSVPGDATYTLGFYLTYSGSGLRLLVETVVPPNSFVGPPGSYLWTNAGYASSPAYGWLAVDTQTLNAYFSHHSQGTAGPYTTDKFDASGNIVKSWSRNDRVVAFLSNGKLLTREGAFFDVCDGNGTIEYSFPGGSLKFAGEYYDTGSSQARCSFTEAVLADPSGSGSGSALRVSVYSIATNELSSLK